LILPYIDAAQASTSVNIYQISQTFRAPLTRFRNGLVLQIAENCKGCLHDSLKAYLLWRRDDIGSARLSPP
jgi:hypothetical protein